MQVHHYQPDTREFLCSTLAKLDPLATKNAGQAVYLIPRNATDIAPPAAGIKEKAVFSSGSWQLLPDHRGESQFDDEGQERLIEELGVVPNGRTAPSADLVRPIWDADADDWVEGATAAELQTDLENAIIQKAAEIQLKRAAELGQGVATTIDGPQGPITLQTAEDKDVPRWIMAICEWLLGLMPELMQKVDPVWFAEKMAETTVIRDADDQVNEIPIADFLQAMGLVGGKLRATLIKQWSLKDQAAKAKTKQELEAVKW